MPIRARIVKPLERSTTWLARAATGKSAGISPALIPSRKRRSTSAAAPAVYAVSPGGATATKAVRNAGPLLKYLFIPIVNLIPGMNQTPETAARRYLQASEFGTDVSGQFFASAQGKFSGPIEAQRHPHLHDRASQEAAWQAVVKASGVDLS